MYEHCIWRFFVSWSNWVIYVWNVTYSAWWTQGLDRPAARNARGIQWSSWLHSAPIKQMWQVSIDRERSSVLQVYITATSFICSNPESLFRVRYSHSAHDFNCQYPVTKFKYLTLNNRRLCRSSEYTTYGPCYQFYWIIKNRYITFI